MTLNEYINSLIKLRDEHEAGDYSVKILQDTYINVQGEMTPWCNYVDITAKNVDVSNNEVKTVYIHD